MTERKIYKIQSNGKNIPSLRAGFLAMRGEHEAGELLRAIARDTGVKIDSYSTSPDGPIEHGQYYWAANYDRNGRIKSARRIRLSGAAI